jgi:saccharopepsin
MNIDADYDGIMGLAFDSLNESSIIDAIDEAYNDTKLGFSPILNIFSQDGSLPNIVTIYMDRTSDLESTSHSSFTIGEYVEGLESIRDEPQLPRFIAKDGNTRWTVLMDGMEVNGVPTNLQTSAQGVPNGKAVALMDTGTSLALIPADVANAIYSNITHAFFSEDLGTWVLPCTTDPTNVTFVFG